LDKAIAGCLADDVAEIVSLGKTLKSWRAEILAHHTTGASNGPTEGLNLCVKKVKRLSVNRPRVPQLRALPTPRPPPRRRRQLANATSASTDPNPCSPLIRVEPLNPGPKPSASRS
jgi:hypothetical protein